LQVLGQYLRYGNKKTGLVLHDFSSFIRGKARYISKIIPDNKRKYSGKTIFEIER
jgi:hypothetical protein